MLFYLLDEIEFFYRVIFLTIRERSYNQAKRGWYNTPFGFALKSEVSK